MQIPPLELKILGILWDTGENLGVQQVIDSWPEKELPGYTTVLKKLQIMEEKGLVAHEKSGRSHLFYPLVKKDQVSKGKIQDLLTGLFGGNRVEMAAAFFRDEKLSQKELTEVKKIIEEMEEGNA